MSAVLAERPLTLDEILGPEWRDPWWRLNNLYWIVDEQAQAVRFAPNEEQTEYYRNLWYRNLILKARQLGFSTFELLLKLDQALFNATFTGVVIADTKDNAGKLFAKLEFAYDRLPAGLKEALPLKSRESRSMLVFAHGSTVSVSTSARGGTVQDLHVSEMGKIGAKHPEKAQEIVSGAFEAVPRDGRITVESTAEGQGGEFHDLVIAALKRKQEKAPETVLDFRLHFFPWYRKAAYRLDPAGVILTDANVLYFRDLEAKHGIVLDPAQKAWYAKKLETQKRKMKREYPSTPQEAFEVAIEGGVYGEEMASMRERGRLLDHIPIDPTAAVNTFWDLGASKKTQAGNAGAIWLHQYVSMQHRFIGYHQKSGQGLGYWKKWLHDWQEVEKIEWGTDYVPHDAGSVVLGEDTTTKAQILGEGLYPRKNVIVVPRIADIGTGIEITRGAMVKDTYIDKTRCVDGVKSLDGYQFVWNPDLGVWSGEPLHNWASDGADAFRQWAQGFLAPAVRDRHQGRRQRNWKVA